LEEINRARMDPMAEAARFGISLFEGMPAGEISGNPVQPIVFNAKLITAASAHSQDMISNDYFSHYSLDGSSPFQRMQSAGYSYSTAGENIAFRGSTAYLEEVSTVIKQHKDLFVDENYPDRGHRVNMLSSGFKELGVGVAFGDYQGYTYSYMLTCDFATAQSYSGMFVLGVVYDDQDGDQFYDAGEGLSNVSIDVAGVGTTTTATAGGYGLPVGAGTYTVTATQSDGTSVQKSVTLTSKNKKVDFLASEFGTSGTPAPSPSQIIGADAGVTALTVSPTQPLSLVVNLTNAALLTPTYEWIWFKVSEVTQSSEIYVLTFSGWQAWTAIHLSGIPGLQPRNRHHALLGRHHYGQYRLGIRGQFDIRVCLCSGQCRQSGGGKYGDPDGTVIFQFSPGEAP